MIDLMVIKSTRACNLRCPYCYYINEHTPNYGSIISEQTIEAVYSNVAAYIGATSRFNFVWHGGEPLLMGRKRFQRFLDLQRQYFNDGQVHNVLQSNGALITQDWIDFFRNNNVGVGISLDGDEEHHNATRVTRSGKGTYEKVVGAIRLFQSNGMQVGVICVADGRYDGYATLRHFQELGVPLCDFLIPITNNALQAVASEEGRQIDFGSIGTFLTDAFRAWVENPDPPIRVRLFESLIQNAFGLPQGCLNAGSLNLAENVVLETNGDVCLDTDFWQIDRFDVGEQYRLKSNIHDQDFSFPRIEEQLNALVRQYGLDRLPDACQRCRMRSICHASHPASRYAADRSFNHRSAYCDAMFALSEAVLRHVNRIGLSHELYDTDLQHDVLHRTVAPADTYRAPKKIVLMGRS
jgi:uncharacterized protein